MVMFNRIPIGVMKVVNSNSKRKSMIEIYRNTNSVYNHITKVIRRLVDLGLLTLEREGRYNFIELTPKGKEFMRLLYKLEDLLPLGYTNKKTV